MSAQPDRFTPLAADHAAEGERLAKIKLAFSRAESEPRASMATEGREQAEHRLRDAAERRMAAEQIAEQALEQRIGAERGAEAESALRRAGGTPPVRGRPCHRRTRARRRR